MPDPGRSGFYVFCRAPAAALTCVSWLEIFDVDLATDPGEGTDGIGDNGAGQRDRGERFAAREVKLSNLVPREPFSEDDVVTPAVGRAEHAHPCVGDDRPARVRGADDLGIPLARDEIVRGWIVALAILTGLPR